MSCSMTTSPVKDGRRVLGDKTPNASWTPAKKHTTELEKSKATAIPLKPLQESPKPRNTSPPACHAGQKRTIDEVEENASDSEPRKALITSRAQREDTFPIFEDSSQQETASQTQTPRPDAIDASEMNPSSYSRQKPSNSSEHAAAVATTTVPTEPKARRRFIQQRAALARKRIEEALGPAIRRVEESISLDRALCEFEAKARTFSRNRIISSDNTSRPESVAGSASESAPMSEQRNSPAVRPQDHHTQEEEDDMPTPRPAQHHSLDQEQDRAEANSPSSSWTNIHQRAGRYAALAIAVEKKYKVDNRNAVDKMIEKADRETSEQAVDGLMKLMETTTEYDNLDTWKPAGQRGGARSS